MWKEKGTIFSYLIIWLRWSQFKDSQLKYVHITYYKYTAVPEQKLKYGLQKRPRSDEVAAFFKYRRIFWEAARMWILLQVQVPKFEEVLTV